MIQYNRAPSHLFKFIGHGDERTVWKTRIALIHNIIQQIITLLDYHYSSSSSSSSSGIMSGIISICVSLVVV